MPRSRFIYTASFYRLLRIVSSLAVILLALHLQPAVAQTPASDHPATNQPLTPLACEDGAQSSGAVYRICMPSFWNKNLLVYAHGYVSPQRPIAIPEEQLSLGGISLDQIANLQGYAFATTSYNSNGLAVQQGIADLVDLAAIFMQKQGAPNNVILIGVSEGGLITALAAERYPDVFDGALALCGPYGSFRQQINYFGDFRTLFDYFFPGLIPPSPVAIPADLTTTWATSFYSNTVRPALVDPANADKVTQLLAAAKAPFSAGDPTSQESVIQNLLTYNIDGTNDANSKLQGQPYDNQGRLYSGSNDDAALNQNVQRFSADAAALNLIAAQYETSGLLAIPLVTMHTNADPIVPAQQGDLYLAKTKASGSTQFHEHIVVNTFGHCAFGLNDVQNAFNRVNALVANPPKRNVYLPLINSQ